MANNTTAGTISVKIVADGSSVSATTEQVQQQFRRLGESSVSSMQATSASLRLLEGGLNNNLRAAERFLSGFQGIRAVMQAAFPIAGLVAVGGILGELVGHITEAVEAFQKLQEAPQRIAAGFEALNQPITLVNDQLRVSNDQLSNQIAKLTGKPQNGVALALDEARLASDKLSESLRKNFDDLGKLLTEQNVGGIKAFLAGIASTTDIKESVVGKDGFGGYKGQITSVTSQYDEQLANATTSDQARQIQAQKDAAVEKILSDALADVNKKLSDRVALQRQAQQVVNKPIAVDDFGNVLATTPSQQGGLNQGAGIAELQGLQANLRSAQAQYNLSRINSQLTGRRDQLQASNANNAPTPYDDELRKLQAELAGVRQEATAADSNPFAQAIVKGAAQATQEVSRLNAELEKQHKGPLTGQQTSNISQLEQSIALAKAQTAQTEALNKDAEDLNVKLAEQAQHHQQNLDKLNEQIAAAQKLRTAEAQGPDAAARARVDLRAAGVGDPDEQTKTRQLGEIEYQAQIEKTVASINRETAAINGQIAAYGKGVQAQRDAQEARIKASGQSPDEINAQLAQLRSQNHLDDLQSGSLRGGQSASDGLKQFMREWQDGMQSLGKITKDTLNSALTDVNDNLAKLLNGQKVNWSGVFKGLSENLLKSGLSNAEGSIFGKLGGGTGQKSPLDEVFHGLGLGNNGKPDGSSNNPLYVTSVGPDGAALSTGGGLLGGLLGGKKKDDSSLYSLGDDDYESDDDDDNDDSSDADSSIVGKATGGLGGVFGTLLKTGIKALGHFSSGGSVSAGDPIVVGDGGDGSGSELFVPGASGSIVPHNQLGSSAASGHSTTNLYNINAQGTDPVLTERRTQKAILAANRSAVQQSGQNQADAARRLPR